MKIYVVSLGCVKNQVDTEVLIHYFCKYGHELVTSEKEAQAVIIMTCAFIAPARQETEETLLEFIRKKKRYNFKVLVGGCYPSRYKDSVEELFPEIDLWFGISSFEKIGEYLNSLEFGGNKNQILSIEKRYSPFEGRVLTTPSHWAWLKISDGCDHRCAYCAIPQIRGPLRSRTKEDILAEADKLVSQGVRELNVVAQDTGVYGKDLYGRGEIASLVADIARLPLLNWLRILYLNPQSISDDLIELIASEPKIVKYLDIPMQHSSEKVLRKMGRPGGYEDHLSLINKLREAIPGIAIRSTFIIGFPDEGEEDFELLKKFLIEARINRAGFYTYSREEGTPAFEYGDPVPLKVKNERLSHLIAIQNEISTEISKGRKGQSIEVMIDSEKRPGDTRAISELFNTLRAASQVRYICRSQWDAPAVDGLVFAIPSEKKDFKPGELVKVKIEKTASFDALGYL